MNHPYGLHFSPEILEEVKEQFLYVDYDKFIGERLFFDNAGGSFRLKSAEKTGREVRVADSNKETGGVDADTIVSLIDENTALLSVMYASNMTGAIYDIEEIVKKARAKKPDLTKRDLILAIGFEDIGYTEAVREYEKRNVIVYDRLASSIYSKRMLASFGLDGAVRVSPLHCNSREDMYSFLRTTKEIIAAYKK